MIEQQEDYVVQTEQRIASARRVRDAVANTV
jgi:hypothetical protein